MTTGRPNPDALLTRVNEQEARHGKGRLKVFLGATAGVGKTYAMLLAARARRAEGKDVVVGVVETHGRKETASLLEGLERVPARALEHRSVSLTEFDLDRALARRPAVLLLDELAHTNAPGSRHAKRYQDAQELLDAGIHVYTTLNVQHLESLNDVVAQITGVAVQETVPDGILDEADEVELVDLPPEDLLRRLQEGKVYVPEQAERAARSFFRKGNLIALRELALRRTAERVDAQMRSYRRDHGIAATWPAAERLLVCLGANPGSARLIRATRRMASGLRAEWTALYIETPAHPRFSEADREALAANLRLAEDLGGRTAIVPGHAVADEILAWAREHNVSKIVAGKPTHPRWRDRLRGSLVDALVRGSGDIDVYVISGDATSDDRPLRGRSVPSRPSDYAWSLAIVALSTAVSGAMWPFFHVTDLLMVYLLGVVLAATRLGRGPSALASVLSVAAVDFCFVPPYFTFAVTDKQYGITFGVMLVVALLISDLATRVREQAEMARLRERRTAVLYAASRDLAATPAGDEIARASARHVSDAVSASAAIVVARPDGALVPISSRDEGFGLPPRDEAVARWVLEHGRKAGRGTDTLPGADALFLPLLGTRGAVAVLGARAPSEGEFTTEQFQILEALASQTAAALERAQLAEAAQKARVDVETERLRNALLSSVSHDLRTPLATITGAASSLMEEPSVSEATRRELTTAIFEEGDRLNRLVGNLLDMTRLESGAIRVRRDWESIEEIVGAALTRVETRLRGRRIETAIPDDLPLVSIDGILIEQVLVNLLENAAKHTPPEAPIEVSVWLADGVLSVTVADRGPGLAPGAEARVFEKFYRTESGAGGVGLGLTICRGIVTAHGGQIATRNREGGGAAFSFTLPIEGTPPSVPAEEGEAAR